MSGDGGSCARARLPLPQGFHFRFPAQMHTHTCGRRQHGVRSHTRALNLPSPNPVAPRSPDDGVGQGRTAQRPTARLHPWCAGAGLGWEQPCAVLPGLHQPVLRSYTAPLPCHQQLPRDTTHSPGPSSHSKQIKIQAKAMH